MDIKKIFNPGSSQLRTNIAKMDRNKVDTEILLEKAYTEGIYADTPANRKLGRVGMTYTAYAEKVKKESFKENEDNIKFDLVEAERGIYNLYPNPIELKATSSYVRKISAKDSKSGGIEYEVFLDFKNGKKINSESERLNNQTEVKEWIKNKIKEDLIYNERKLDECLFKIEELKKKKNYFKEDTEALKIINKDIDKQKEKLNKICPNYEKSNEYINKILDTDERGKRINIPKDCVESIKFLLRFNGITSSEYDYENTEKGHYISLI